MELPIFKKQEEKIEHLWSLAIGKNWVDSAVWKVVGQEVYIVARGGVFPYQEGNVDSIVEAADGSLSNAASLLTEDAGHLSKVVFGLSPFYLQDGEIKKEWVGVLKKLSQELELSPAGFVVIPEAIIHFLRVQEGGVTNAIIAGVSQEHLEISLIQNGKSVGTTEVGRSLAMGADIAEGLARLPSVAQYPTRILLYDHKSADLEHAKQSLLEVDWDKHALSFLHTPKVEVLPEETVISAVSLAGGAEVAQATSLARGNLSTREKESDETVIPSPPELAAQEVEEVIAETEEEFPGVEHANVTTVRPEELGFTEGISVHTPRGPLPPVSSPSSFSQPARSLLKKRSGIGGVLSFFSHIPVPHLRAPSVRGVGKPSLLIGMGVVMLLLLLLWYWYLPKSKIALIVSPKHFEQEIEFLVNTQSLEVDTGAKTIPGRYMEIAETVTKTKDATGTKNVGDRARGEITINRIGPAITLPKGTIIVSGTLKFTLDKDVAVASGSGLSSIGHNTESATVTAVEIGQNGNLAAGKDFKVGTYSQSTIDAKNDKAFSGGTSREVAAVGVADLKDLEAEATADLKTQAEVQLKEQLDGEEIVISDTSAMTINKKEFSAKAGDEARTIDLALSGNARFVVVKRSSLAQIIQAQATLPAGFSLQSDQITVETKSVKATTYRVLAQGNMVPQVKPEELIGKISGKSAQAARDILAETPGFVRAEISTKYQFPLIGTLPHLKRNITLEVVAER